MGWTETHRRWQALREVETELATAAEVRVPWREDYAELFGDPDGLVAMLRYRWQLTCEAQLDPSLNEDVLDAQQRTLASRSTGVRRLLEEYDAGGRHAAA